MNLLKQIKSNYISDTVLVLIAAISIASFLFFYSSGQHLLYADAMSRLNIARKVVDNLTPGLAQLGSVWLPLPQVLMLPFVWNDFLWHSGIAGSIMSMTCYVISSLYIFKTARLITRSDFSSFLVMLIYSLNINILYLQTTAMSELLFCTTLAATMYYFLMWLQTNNKMYLIPAGIAVSAMTFTRYEGLAVLFSSIPMVFIISLLRNKKLAIAEAHIIMYGTIAVTGFLLWTIYLAAIFGDPLFWINYYATPQATGDSSNTVVYTQAKPFLAAVWQYFTSVSWMSGLIPVGFAALGTIVLLFQSARKKSLEFLPMLMPLSIFLFMVLTLMRNTPIVQPALTIQNILSSETSYQTGFNIRYGLLMMPWVALMSAYVFQFRKVFFNGIIFLIFIVQLINYMYPAYSSIYQIPAKIYAKPYFTLVDYLKTNYDDGPIMVSAASHEDQMFEMGFEYRTFIHEGAGKYWKESLDDPPRYAKWIIIDYGHPQDEVAKHLRGKSVLQRDYNRVFKDKQVEIYKIKKQPYFDIGV